MNLMWTLVQVLAHQNHNSVIVIVLCGKIFKKMNESRKFFKYSTVPECVIGGLITNFGGWLTIISNFVLENPAAFFAEIE